MPCLTISGEDRNNEKREVASEQCASTVFTWKTTPSNSRAKNAVTGQATALEEKIAVGYSDGSIALMSFPLFSPATREGGGQRDPARMTTRRIKRVDLDGGMAFEASITALCALCAPLIVVGDSEGRLALWTTSASSSSTGRCRNEDPWYSILDGIVPTCFCPSFRLHRMHIDTFRNEW